MNMREEFEKWWNSAVNDADFGGRGEWKAWQAAYASHLNELCAEVRNLGYATGHGDSVSDVVHHLVEQVRCGRCD